jgi:signal transduction histidine kinase
MTEHPGPVGRLRAWARRPAAQDATLAAALLLACVLVNEPPASAPWWAGSALATAAVALRRRWPVATLAAGAAGAAAHAALLAPLMIIDLALPILVYTMARRTRWAVSLAALGLLVLLCLTAGGYFAVRRSAPNPPDPRPAVQPHIRPMPGEPRPDDPAGPLDAQMWAVTWTDQPGLALALVAAWAVGSGARSRQAYLDELRARAADLERERDQRAALAVAAERGRISRELHDVVAHGLSVMVIQAQGGAAALEQQPADTRAALEAIVKTGRESLADMRRVLATAGASGGEWRPPPGLAGLPALLDQVREAGTPVRLRVAGEPAPLPSTVDLSAYRIVQESLTNTMKHAGAGARAEVVVSYTAGEVRLIVTDDGAGPVVPVADDGPGSGLRGMRERVTLLGGRFAAGPGPSGGFEVRAALPLDGGRA